MKKYIRFFVVLALVLAVIGLARNNSVWASNVAEPMEKASSSGLQNSAEFNPVLTEITITESGIYNIGGICTLDVTYELLEGLRDDVDINVPTEFSTNIPFGYEGDLYLPGCHILHYKNDEMMKEMTADDGSWKVCFAERPEVDLTIYYYYEEPFTDSQIWIELETTHEDGLACASAPYSGEYAPGSKIDDALGPVLEEEYQGPPLEDIGSVVPPPPSTHISESGTYSVGGICSLRVIYKKSRQSDEIQVADTLRYNSDTVAGYDYDKHADFPKDEGLLYFPGCHVVHYKLDDITRWKKTDKQGEWEICFATQPGKEMTIYVYLGDYEYQQSEWYPLETTVENGEVCAPAFFTGVYVPAGK